MEEHNLYNGKIKLEYDETKHKYYHKGNLVIGVSDINSIIAKPVLIPWSTKEAVKYLGFYDKKTWTGKSYRVIKKEDLEVLHNEFCKKFEELKSLTAEEFYQRLYEAKGAADRYKKYTAMLGTAAHSMIEQYLQGKQPLVDPALIDTDANIVRNIFSTFRDWREQQRDLEFTETERLVYSKKYKYAGRLDNLYARKVGGKKILGIGDIKTARSIHPENFFQTAMYMHAIIEETGLPIEERMIIHVPVLGGLSTYVSGNQDDFKADMRAAVNAMQLKKRYEEVEKLIKES